MKKLLAILLAVLLPAIGLLFVSQPESHAGTPARKRYVDGQVLVQFRETAGPAWAARRMAEEALSSRLAAVQELETFEESAGGGLVLVDLAPGVSVEEAVAAAAADPRVEYAEPNYLVRPAATMPNDVFFAQQWGLNNTGAQGGKAGADIGAPGAWDTTTGDDQIVVAVTDSGVELSHPDLAANAWVNPREVPGNGVDDDGNGFIDDINGWNFFAKTNQVADDPIADFHGTHVAGIIGARGNNGVGVTGVAWNVKLMALKFIGREGGETNGSIADAVRAINYAIAMRKRGENVRVINASWGGPDESNSLRKAIKKAGKAGILFVTAAGNGGEDGRGDDIDRQPDFPASWSSQLNSVVAVAALDRGDGLPIFSNFGRLNVTVAAPGAAVFSTVPGGQYGALNGTSMAAPHVAGIAVLLLAKEPNLTPAQLRQRLIDTAEPLLPLSTRTVSAGRVSAFNALNNRVVTPALGVAAVSANKKVLTLEGLGFASGRTVIEADGVALTGVVKFDAASRHASNTFRRVTIKLGKAGMNAAFPIGVPVSVTAFDPTTGTRAAPVRFTRF